MTLKPILENLVTTFNEKVEMDADLRKDLEGICKKIQIDLGSERYRLILENQRISCFDEGTIDDPDITLISDPDTIQGLISGSMKPMKALALKKLKVKGSLEDILRLRKLF
ncbi:MAG: SCP2 sterol-binding domain-containing protein [Methanomassiliicoccales archaeon]|jgi:putative sterol carrier protein|nr:SCP2 sterol-binding domain-containing protein [Methanomassiliicoccales archaeon]